MNPHWQTMMEQEIAECERRAAENKNGSRTWWLARMSGVRYALSLMRYALSLEDKS